MSVEPGAAADLELVASLDRSLRGAAHGPDLELLLWLGGRLLVVRDGGRRGHALLDEGRLAVVAGADEETASTLLWAALAECEPGVDTDVQVITGPQQWAVGVVVAAGLQPRLCGPLCVRGQPGPLAPYRPHNAYLQAAAPGLAASHPGRRLHRRSVPEEPVGALARPPAGPGCHRRRRDARLGGARSGGAGPPTTARVAVSGSAGQRLEQRFATTFDGLAAIGRDAASGGYHRFAWTAEDRAARAWFTAEAAARGLQVECDRNGNLWAWWGGAGPGAVATGSHLDTVPDGGAFDGALGVVSGLLAVEELARRGVRPARPIGVVAFADEEGARFGIATFGSRLATGALRPAGVLEREGRDCATVRAALAAAGVDPDGIGPDPERLSQLASFVELHIEQGSALAEHDAAAAVAVGSRIWPHGRWRLEAVGEANHAGTTRMTQRRDPAAVLAVAIASARARAQLVGGVATLGRILVHPNSTNSVPGRVSAWLDARAAGEPLLDRLLEGWWEDVWTAAERGGVSVSLTEESRSRGVEFDPDLRGRLAAVLGRAGAAPPELPTAAGHDAGALAAAVPSAMLFVRNPTGISHSPAEHAEPADCIAGVHALTAVLEELACR